ncbi:hypothetical protein AOLI_G00027330 [Acnodon oligacanthus]
MISGDADLKAADFVSIASENKRPPRGFCESTDVREPWLEIEHVFKTLQPHSRTCPRMNQLKGKRRHTCLLEFDVDGSAPEAQQPAQGQTDQRLKRSQLLNRPLCSNGSSP